MEKEKIIKYLTGKTTRVVDIKDFFTIINGELPIIEEEISEFEYLYTLTDCCYKVILKPSIEYKKMKVISEVIFEEKE